MSLPNPLHRPYPRDVYPGDGGVVSAWLRPDGTEPELSYANGGSCEYLATGDQGAKTSYEPWAIAPESYDVRESELRQVDPD